MANDPIRRGISIKRVKIDGFAIDAVMSYEPVHEAEATEHPIEQGANPTDHIRTKPVTLQIEGMQSATPVDAELRTEPAEKLALRPREAYDFLEKLIGRIVTVETEFRIYENMALLRLSAPRDASTGEVLNFSAQFRQVRIVSNLTVEEPTALLSKKVTKNLGKQVTKPTDAATQSKSLLAKGVDSETGTAVIGKVKQYGNAFIDAIRPRF